jgi:hypothetical protein
MGLTRRSRGTGSDGASAGGVTISLAPRARALVAPASSCRRACPPVEELNALKDHAAAMKAPTFRFTPGEHLQHQPDLGQSEIENAGSP